MGKQTVIIQKKTKQLTAGIVIYMGVNLLMYCNEIIIAIDNGKAF